MNFFEYLPHEYSYALYLAYEFDLHPYDSMISNMVSERYPREEDEECASTYGSENCEENQVQNDDSSSVFATMANNDPDIVFGNFHQESNLEKVQMLSIDTINPSIEGNSIKIGAITCFIDSAISQSIVPAFSSPITVERPYDGNIRFLKDQDQTSKKGETLSDLLQSLSESFTFFSYHRDLCVIVFDPDGIMSALYSFAIMLCILSIFNSVSTFPFDPGGIFLCKIGLCFPNSY
ncbi:hypothetical protein QL285_025712 [Trifolium repens]|nr:hypothetical protein QL285_025712 [Trifolium repens]